MDMVWVYSIAYDGSHVESFYVNMGPMGSSGADATSHGISSYNAEFFEAFGVSSTIAGLSFVGSRGTQCVITASHDFTRDANRVILSSIESADYSNRVQCYADSRVVSFASPVCPVQFVFTQEAMDISSYSYTDLHDAEFFPISSEAYVSYVPVSSGAQCTEHLGLGASVFVVT